MSSPAAVEFRNPFRPGAGHTPPFLAGRRAQRDEFAKLLEQDIILQNLVLTGLRGVGKTVLLDSLKPVAQEQGWLWVGTDLSESASISEEHLATRLLADISVVSSALVTRVSREAALLSRSPTIEEQALDHAMLERTFSVTPGLVADKLKAVLAQVRAALPASVRGIVFAYDEAQNLADHAGEMQYPLSVMLETFQSIQRMDMPFMLVLTGLPTLFPKLVQARTYSERMFRVLFLDRLTRSECEEAIRRPIDDNRCPVVFTPESVNVICEHSCGYPYFLQFMCREAYDTFIQQLRTGRKSPVPIAEILTKLDSDFFAGRWARATDRQRDLLRVIALLPNEPAEFSVQDLVDLARTMLAKPFSASHVSQMLGTLSEAGLIYKNRHGRYSFAVPLLGAFIRRQEARAKLG